MKKIAVLLALTLTLLMPATVSAGKKPCEETGRPCPSPFFP